MRHTGTHWDTLGHTGPLCQSMYITVCTVATCRIYVDKLQSRPVILYSTGGRASENLSVNFCLQFYKYLLSYVDLWCGIKV